MMMRTPHYRSQVHIDHLRSNGWVLPLTMKKRPSTPIHATHTHTLTDRKTQTPTPLHATHTHTDRKTQAR